MCDIPTNCPNCSAPINTLHNKCEYCDTPYPWKKEAEIEDASLTFGISCEEYAKAVQSFVNVLTPNQIRRRVGLRDI